MRSSIGYEIASCPTRAANLFGASLPPPQSAVVGDTSLCWAVLRRKKVALTGSTDDALDRFDTSPIASGRNLVGEFIRARCP